jgi:hypothetical protein
MSRSALLIFGAAAIILGIAAILTMFPAGGTAPQGPLLGVAASEIVALRVEDSGRVQSIYQDDNGRWRYRSPERTQRSQDDWPILRERANGVTRVLAGMTAMGRGRAFDDAGAIDVEVGLADGSWRVLQFDGVSVGGRRSVRIDGDVSWLVDASLVDALTTPGPSQWRIPRALPEVDLDVARVTIESADLRLVLSRTGNSWRIAEPITARADDSAVRRLLTTLVTFEVIEFLDDEGRTNVSLANSRVRITCETEVRRLGAGDDVETETRTESVSLGGPADIAANTFFATNGAGDRFTVDGGALGQLPMAPESYVARIASAQSPEDVGMLEIALENEPTRAFRRGLGTWSELQPDGLVADADSTEVEGLLELFCVAQAQHVTLQKPDDFAPHGAVTLFDFDGGPLARFPFGETPGGVLIVEVMPPGAESPLFLHFAGIALGDDVDTPATAGPPSD